MDMGKLESDLADCCYLHSTRARLSSDTATFRMFAARKLAP
jgi:hypothetical protein